MGDVIVTYRITPESPEVDMEALVKEVSALVPKAATVQRLGLVPGFYGMKVIDLNFRISDKIGGIDEFETAVSGLPSVGSITTEEMGLA